MSKTILLLIGCLMVLAACTPSDSTIPLRQTPSVNPTITATVKVTPTLSVRGRWLQGVPCAPPCWEGITPGTTTFTESLTLLENAPYISEQTVTIHDDYSGIYIHRVMPGDRAGLQEHSTSISAAPLGEGGVVKRIFLSAPKMKLGEVVAQYGTPSHVRILIEPIGPHGVPEHWRVTLLWLSQGFEMNVLGGLEFPNVDERFVVGQQIIYFPPGIAGYEETMGGDFAAHTFIPWDGYGQLDYQVIIGD